MAYDSRATLVARLTEIRTEITKARKALSYGTASGIRVTRQALRELRDEENEILARIEQIDAASSGGFANRAEFKRPI